MLQAKRTLSLHATQSLLSQHMQVPLIIQGIIQVQAPSGICSLLVGNNLFPVCS